MGLKYNVKPFFPWPIPSFIGEAMAIMQLKLNFYNEIHYFLLRDLVVLMNLNFSFGKRPFFSLLSFLNEISLY